ncbi:MAG: hypothetical protein STSR0004_06540 [Peptococcaceae bacterium]
MKILSFHLRSKMAHFRRYYSNSSALSYSIPPRTTLAGILAGLLGYPRDSSYEQFSLDQCRISVALITPIKKQVQKMNLLMVDSPNDLNGFQEHHSQTPTELVLPQNIRRGFIDYQVWVSHQDETVMHDLERLLTLCPLGFGSKGISPALGTAPHLGWLEFGGLTEGIEVLEEEVAIIYSVIPLRQLKEIRLTGLNEVKYRLVKEDVPLEFNSERRITDRGIGTMVINLCSSPIVARVAAHVKLESGMRIVWME